MLKNQESCTDVMLMFHKMYTCPIAQLFLCQEQLCIFLYKTQKTSNNDIF